MLEADYRANGQKSLDRALRSVGHLRPHFKGMRAIDIPSKVADYVSKRKATPAKNATIRLELAALKRMITLAYKAGRLQARPYIQSIEVRNTRSGFFESEQFREVLKHLPGYLKPLVRFAYLTGWRRNEMLTLEWRQVDFKSQTIRLEAGTTKNDEARTFPFATYPELRRLLEEQRDHTTAAERARGSIVPAVFHHNGKPIRDYNHAWREACKAAGCPDRLVHDFRRTAVRNLERAGVPRSVAMKLTGHKTETVYRRYAIVSENDLADGVAKLAALGERTGDG